MRTVSQATFQQVEGVRLLTARESCDGICHTLIGVIHSPFTDKKDADPADALAGCGQVVVRVADGLQTSRFLSSSCCTPSIQSEGYAARQAVPRRWLMDCSPHVIHADRIRLDSPSCVWWHGETIARD
jgi:hypothetical protein